VQSKIEYLTVGDFIELYSWIIVMSMFCPFLLTDVEAAMLVEVQKVNIAYRGLQGLVLKQIRNEFGNLVTWP
jgi:hypothetical protein